jgi:mono/diheme cytochrome c family protein
VGAAAVAAVAFALGGCGTGGYVEGGSQGSGQQLFTQACGSCHVLSSAGTAGRIGPNLDDAFAQARADGMTEATFRQVVAGQIKYPIEQTSTGAPGMPGAEQTLPLCKDVEGDAFCVDDRDEAINAISTYVASVAGTGAPPPPDGQPDGPGAADGKSIFSANCASCHTLADAAATGAVGPNLDESKPAKALVVDRVTNGQGAMPAFEDTLSAEQIEAVSEYVASVAGQG